MKQFFEAYKESELLSPLVRELSWPHNLAICPWRKTQEERAFYTVPATKEKYPFRELDRQINASVYERYMLNDAKLSTPLRHLQNTVHQIFNDTYVLEFLGLTDGRPTGDGVQQRVRQKLL